MSKLFNIGDSFAVGNCIDSFNSKTDFHLSPGGLIADFFNLDELNYAKNGNSFILSATAPETIDIAVATKTTWKKKSEASE